MTVTAHEVLEAGVKHMQDRATTYDKPDGERSMEATVNAFNVITGDGLMNTEERGWLFMNILKMVRSQQGDFKLDNYEDGAAYWGLAAEAAHKERVTVDWPADDRIEAIGQNGNDGAVYKKYRDLEKPETWKRGDIVKLYEDVATTYVELDSVSTDLGLLYWLLYWVDQNDVMKACKIPAHIRNVQSVEARS